MDYLCEDCQQKKKRSDLFKAMDKLETEIMYLEELRDIMRDMRMNREPPAYLYHRVAEHITAVQECFSASHDIAFDRNRE